MPLKFDRDKARNRLNKQRARLKQRNAAPAEIRAYLGVPNTVKFGNLSDEALASLIQRLDEQPPVTVINNIIYPIRYVKATAYVNRHKSSYPLVSSYEKAMKTSWMKQDKTLKESYDRAKALELQRKKNYADMLRGISPLLNDIANKIEKLSPDKFAEFLRTNYGVLGYNELIDVSIMQANGAIDDEDESVAEYVDRVSSLFEKNNGSR